MNEEVNRLINHIRWTLGDINAASSEEPYAYAAVPLCVIDAVFSLGVRFESTRRTVCDWCEQHHWEICRWRATEKRTTTDFIQILQPYELRFEEMAIEIFRNRQRTATRSGILKAEAVYWFSMELQHFGVETLDDALTCDVGTRTQLKLIEC